MKNITRAACLVGAALMVQVSPAALIQPATKSTSSIAPPNPATGKIKILGPEHEPYESFSGQLRREQAARRELRANLDWNNLDPQTQEALWDEAVGPDQLNDGHGKAQVRPSLAGVSPRDPGDPDRGIELVLLSWAYTTQGGSGTAETFAFDMDLNVEGDLSFTGTLVHPNGDLDMKVTELRGVADSTEGWTKNWDLAYHMGASGSASSTWLEGKSCVSDLYGDLYSSGRRLNGKYHITKMDGSAAGAGIRLIDADFIVTGTSTGATVYSSVIDPEGILYVAGAYSEGANFRCFVARHETDATLARTWIVTDTLIASTPLRVVCDRHGGVYFLHTSSANVASVTKLSPYDGAADWTWTAAAGTSGVALDLDFSGNPHVAVYTGAATNDWNTVKLDTLTGAPLWSKTVTNGRPVDLKVDGSGNVFVIGSKGANTTYLMKYDASGSAPGGFIEPQYGTTGVASKLALDWLGNPYVAITYGTTHMSTDVRKFNPATGEEVWHYFLSPTFGTEQNGDVDIVDFLVDSGGSVYVCGNRRAQTSGGSNLSNEFYFIKYEQPYLGIPIIARSNPLVRIENNSLWRPQSPEFSGPVSEWANKHLTLFELDATNLLGNLDYLTQVSVDYGVGTAAGGLDLDFRNATLGVSFDTDVTGGTYDLKATGELAIAVPAENDPTLNPGQNFTLTVNFDPDAAGMELTSQGRPQLSAALNAYAQANMSGSNIFGSDTYLGSFEVPIPMPNNGNINLSHQVVGLDLLQSNVEAGTWFDLVSLLPFPADSYIEGKIRMPEMGTDGIYSDGASGPTMTSSLSEPFLEMGLKLTNMLAERAGYPPLSVGWNTPAGNALYNAEIGLGIMQADLNGTVSLVQDLEMTMRPYVDLTFDDASNPSSRLYLTRVVNSEGGYSYQGTKTVHLPNDGSLTITPTFGMRGKMTNQTGFQFGADVTFNALEITALLEIAGCDVVNLDYPSSPLLFWDLLSPNTDSRVSTALNNGRLNIIDTTNSAQEFDFPNEQQVPVVQVASSSTNNLPQVIGSSRASARMIIYEQISPTQNEFNAAAIGDEPLVIYGRKFFSNEHPKVYISHHGRTEQLTSTYLNDQSLLVELPKRFLLLPGVARLYVTTDYGHSKTIDLPIEYPLANFQGLQDPIWAGDPRWVNTAVVAVDGLTPAGLASFIARRDYYTYLRTNLWPAAFPSLGSAQSYFPAFKGWETGAASCPPGFPTLIIDGVPLARKEHPSGDNGKFWSQMQPNVYSTPRLDVPMTLVNPGPGGGPSRTQYIDIPAPKPVIQQISPRIVHPGSVTGSLKLTVRGPQSVPFFPGGYEEPKYGNFTPESVVMVNTTAMPTEFVSSGQLVATIPASQFSNYGSKSITVVTPGNGTTYYEHLVTGNGSVSFDGTVSSGGTSVPMTLDVSWPAPVVTAVSSATITVGTPPKFAQTVNGQAPLDSHNFSVIGSNFAPGAKVYWNGNLLPSTRSSEGLVRATVDVAQVATAGSARVSVVNPASSGSARQSRSFNVQIVP
ncbi:MAG: hypothetical protein AABZ53_11410 [Planctomycetota bacterium]